jgi:hypothetical protein
MTPRRRQHPVRLGCVHGHARFSHDVLAGFEGRERDGAMQVRPRANDDGVNGGIGD